MASTREPESLKGLARSLVDLFERSNRRGDPGSAHTGGQATPSPVLEIEDPLAAARELDYQLDEFLAGRGSARAAPASRIRELGRGLVEIGRVEPVADAVLRLSMVSGGEAVDARGPTLARVLLTPAVAGRLAARLEAVRDGSRRAMLVRTLSRLGPVMARAAGEALTHSESRSARRALTDVLASVGEEGAEVLAEMVRDERWFVVRNAVLVLGEIGGEWPPPLVKGTLDHPDPRVRREALMALARLGGPDAGRWVTGLIDDPEERVREAAALTAGALRERDAVVPLMGLVEAEESDAVTVAGLRALGRIGDARATDVLERRAGGTLLSRSSTEVRVAAYRALGALGTERARAAIRVGLRDRNAEVRTVVEELMRGQRRG